MTRRSKTIIPIPPATSSLKLYFGTSLIVPNINRHIGDIIHKKVANAIDFDVVALTERKAFASSIDTRLSFDTSSVGMVHSSSSISSLSK